MGSLLICSDGKLLNVRGGAIDAQFSKDAVLAVGANFTAHSDEVFVHGVGDSSFNQQTMSKWLSTPAEDKIHEAYRDTLRLRVTRVKAKEGRSR